MSADADLREVLPDAPEPRPGARDAAIAAAMARFDRADKKNAILSQGFPAGSRRRQQGTVRSPHAGGKSMRRSTYLKIAAGLAVAAVPLTLLKYPMTQSSGLDTISMAASTIDGPTANVAPPPPPGPGKTIGSAAQSILPSLSMPWQSADSSARSAAPSPGVAAERARRSAAGAAGGSDAFVGAAPNVQALAQAPALPAPPGESQPYAAAEPTGRDSFQARDANVYHQAKADPVSTFSLDVDTGSYAFARASLARNQLPQRDAVRAEEFLNYFPYAYPAPDKGEDAFRASISVMPSPWNAGRKLVHVGIKAYAVPAAERPRANLVFLIDTSGSMSSPNRLPLAKQALSLLVDELHAGDTIAIVTYAGEAGIALEPTDVADRGRIKAAIDRLGAGGSTAGAAGLRQAYDLAQRNFDPKGINRIMLATDGDFNVGISSASELKSFVSRKRETGIYLSVLGFGMGNYHDTTMQALAQNGNGTAAYIDGLAEARKALVQEATSAVVPVADDAKAQVEFNPATVAEYRLVGYEKRLLRREDFDNDKVDAGEIGSGHTVTALYEIVPVGATPAIPPLRYGAPADAAKPAAPPAGEATEYGFLKLRYKRPGAKDSTLMSRPFGPGDESRRFEDAPVEARFGVAAAGFAELLRGSPYVGGLTWDAVIAQGLAARGEDPYGYRSEFVQLVRTAKALSERPGAGR